MRLTGAEIVVESLIKCGIPYVLGIPGHGCLGLVDAFIGREKEIRVLTVKHESAAVHMADGYYRWTGRPLAVFTSIGPGATNTVIGTATAYVDSTAVMIITGGTHTYMRGKGVLQEIERRQDADFPRILEPVVKRYWRVDSAAQLPAVMQRAHHVMMSGRRGPVLIDLPMDVQCDSVECEIPEPDRHEGEGAVFPDPIQIQRAVELLAEARRPVILGGGGINACGANQELIALAERLGAAVIMTHQGKSGFPEDHPLYVWCAGSKGTDCGNHFARTADVLLAVGCRFADQSTSSYRHGITYAIPPTRLIHIDIDPAEIGKNYPTEVGVIGHARSALRALLERLDTTRVHRDSTRMDYFREIQEKKAEWLNSVRRRASATQNPVTMGRALKEIRDALRRDAIVLTSSGNTQAQVLQEFPFYEPKTLITTAGFSTMGFSVPAGLGVKLAAPERQVVAILGDGDFLMAIHELATAVQLDLPLVVLVFNNLGWLSIRDLQIGVYGEDRAFVTDFVKGCRSPGPKQLYSPDFKAIAEGFGCHAQKVCRGEEIAPALDAAFASGKPAVMEILVNREYPDSGSPAVGWWDVPVPTYLKERREKYERERAEEKLS